MDTTTTLMRPETVMGRKACGKSQLYRDVKAGLMTPPIRRGHKFSFWPADEVETIIRAEIAGCSEDERRTLVQRLIRRRVELRPDVAA